MRRPPRWRDHPSTPEQQSYLRGLAKDLNIDVHLALDLSRGEASDLIEELKARRDGEPDPPRTALPTARQQIKDYNAEQVRQFGDENIERISPYTTKLIVWKRFPNVMQSPTQILGGWTWACYHPVHRQVVRARNRASFERTWANAIEHFRRTHP